MGSEQREKVRQRGELKVVQEVEVRRSVVKGSGPMRVWQRGAGRDRQSIGWYEVVFVTSRKGLPERLMDECNRRDGPRKGIHLAPVAEQRGDTGRLGSPITV